MFDFLSGSDEAEQAAAANRAAATAAYGQQTDIANQYRGSSLGALGEGLTRSTGALGAGLENQINAYTRGNADAIAAARGGVDAYSPLRDLGVNYGRAVTRYQDALGLNGPGAASAAREAFTTSPGYQFQVDEATDRKSVV